MKWKCSDEGSASFLQYTEQNWLKQPHFFWQYDLFIQFLKQTFQLDLGSSIADGDDQCFKKPRKDQTVHNLHGVFVHLNQK